MLCDEFLALHKKTTRTHGGVVHPPLERLQHLHDQRNDAFGGVVLPALFALRQRKLAKEVFVDVAKDVFAL
ncbi:hypothetical protein D3C79_1054890 [compost metagenome]